MHECFARTGIEWGDYRNSITGMIG